MLAEIEAWRGFRCLNGRRGGVEPTADGTISDRVGGRSVLARSRPGHQSKFAGYRSGELDTVFGRNGGGKALHRSRRRSHRSISARGCTGVNISLDVSTSSPLITRFLAMEFDFVVARIPAGVDPGQFDYHEIGGGRPGLLVRASIRWRPRERQTGGHGGSAMDLASRANLHARRSRRLLLQPRRDRAVSA